MSGKSQLKMGVSLNYILTLVTNVAGFLLMPFMLRMLGDKGYGLYESIGGIAGYMAVLDFGVNSTITRYVAKYRAEHNEDRQKNFLALCLILYSFLAVIVFVIGYFIWINLPNILQSQSNIAYSALEISTAKTMFIILIANVGFSLPLRSFGAVMNGYEKFAFPRLMNIARVVLRLIAIFVLLSLGFGVITIVLVDTLLNLGILLLNMVYVKIILKVKIHLEKFDIAFFKELLLFSLPVFMTMVYDQIFWKVDQTIILIMQGAAAAAVVAITMRIILIFMQLSTSMSEVFLPRVTQMVVNDASPDDLTDLMIRVGRIQFLLLGMIVSGYLIFGQSFFSVYVGGSSAFIDANISNLYYIGVIIMIPLTLPLIQNTGISILVAKNKHRFRSNVYFLIAFLNIGLTILFVKYFGIIGASVSTAIALIIGNGIIINIYYSKVIGLKISRFFKDCLLRLLVPMVVSSAFGYLIYRYLMTQNTWPVLIACCALYAAVYFAVMWFGGFNAYEKDMFKKIVHKVIKWRNV